jgi:hypothetical protein
MKTLLLIIGMAFMPFFYFGFILAGIYTPMSDLYKSLVEHYKSNEPFGGFDDGMSVAISTIEEHFGVEE